jgi:hypothetical protein
MFLSRNRAMKKAVPVSAIGMMYAWLSASIKTRKTPVSSEAVRRLRRSVAPAEMTYWGETLGTLSVMPWMSLFEKIFCAIPTKIAPPFVWVTTVSFEFRRDTVDSGSCHCNVFRFAGCLTDDDSQLYGESIASPKQDQVSNPFTRRSVNIECIY